jgi:hypothetical protein
MSKEVERIRKKLKDLGERIDAKIEEFRKQGVLHGAARQAAAELQIQHARVSKLAQGERIGVGGAIVEELATDTEILNHSFDRWVAQIDRESEA